MAKYECTVCGFIYDEEKEGKKWETLPEDWVCPVCASPKTVFKKLQGAEESPKSPVSPAPPSAAQSVMNEKTAKKLICSVCGFIVREGYPGDLCPACGAVKTAFQPYKDIVARKRRNVLNLHLHPVMTHFPQAFSVFMLFLIGMGFVLQGSLKTDAVAASKVLALFLPLSVAAGIISGLLDGKTRFKRLTTPLLKKKIMVGILFFILSVGVLLVLNFSNLQTWWHGVSAALTGLCVLCSVFLGYNGGRLAEAIVPD